MTDKDDMSTDSHRAPPAAPSEADRVARARRHARWAKESTKPARLRAMQRLALPLFSALSRAAIEKVNANTGQAIIDTAGELFRSARIAILRGGIGTPPPSALADTPPPPGTDSDFELWLAGQPLTDEGNAFRMFAKHSHELVYIAPTWPTVRRRKHDG